MKRTWLITLIVTVLAMVQISPAQAVTTHSQHAKKRVAARHTVKTSRVSGSLDSLRRENERLKNALVDAQAEIQELKEQVAALLKPHLNANIGQEQPFSAPGNPIVGKWLQVGIQGTDGYVFQADGTGYILGQRGAAAPFRWATGGVILTMRTAKQNNGQEQTFRQIDEDGTGMIFAPDEVIHILKYSISDDGTTLTLSSRKIGSFVYERSR